MAHQTSLQTDFCPAKRVLPRKVVRKLALKLFYLTRQGWSELLWFFTSSSSLALATLLIPISCLQVKNLDKHQTSSSHTDHMFKLTMILHLLYWGLGHIVKKPLIAGHKNKELYELEEVHFFLAYIFRPTDLVLEIMQVENRQISHCNSFNRAPWFSFYLLWKLVILWFLIFETQKVLAPNWKSVNLIKKFSREQPLKIRMRWSLFEIWSSKT